MTFTRNEVGLLVQDVSQLASSERLLTRGVSETEVFPKVGLTRGLSQLGLTRGFSEVFMTRGFSEVGFDERFLRGVIDDGEP